MVDNKEVEPLRESYWLNKGYVIEVKPKHWVLKARYLIETITGHTLSVHEEVGYKDGNNRNCVVSNLIVKDFPNKQEWWLDESNNRITRSTPLWCRKYHECRKCHSNVKPHKGIGLCTSCYYLDYWGKM